MKSLLLLPALVLPALLVAQSQSFSTPAGEMKITPLYHASVLIQAGGKVIYVDPAKPAQIEGLPKADLILVTHLHSDHFDPTYLAELSKPGTEVIAPATVVEKFPAAHPIASGEERQWQQFSIQAVPAYNLVRGPAPGKLYHPRGRDNGYILSFGGMRFYFSGDTEATPEMRALKNIDVAFLCMRLPYTMPPEEAADALKAFHPKVVIPYHYQGSDLKILEQKLAGSGIEVRLLNWYPS